MRIPTPQPQRFPKRLPILSGSETNMATDQKVWGSSPYGCAVYTQRVMLILSEQIDFWFATCLPLLSRKLVTKIDQSGHFAWCRRRRNNVGHPALFVGVSEHRSRSRKLPLDDNYRIQ